MERAYKVICSNKAASCLSQEECRPFVERAIHLAYDRDRGVHEGLVFSIELHGTTWAIVVDIGGCWVKVMGKDELGEAIKDAVTLN